MTAATADIVLDLFLLSPATFERFGVFIVPPGESELGGEGRPARRGDVGREEGEGGRELERHGKEGEARLGGSDTESFPAVLS